MNWQAFPSISIINIRLTWDCLIFIMGVTILVRQHLILRWPPAPMMPPSLPTRGCRTRYAFSSLFKLKANQIFLSTQYFIIALRMFSLWCLAPKHACINIHRDISSRWQPSHRIGNEGYFNYDINNNIKRNNIPLVNFSYAPIIQKLIKLGTIPT